MKQLRELVEQTFPDVIDRGQQPARKWLEKNGWTYVAGEGDESTFHDPVTKSNYILEQCLYRQNQRPFEETVCHLLRTLSLDGASALSAEIVELKGKLTESSKIINDLSLDRDTVTALAAETTTRIRAAEAALQTLRNENAQIEDALAASNAQVESLKAQIAGSPATAATSSPAPTS
jgi:aminopeptidase C